MVFDNIRSKLAVECKQNYVFFLSFSIFDQYRFVCVFILSISLYLFQFSIQFFIHYSLKSARSTAWPQLCLYSEITLMTLLMTFSPGHKNLSTKLPDEPQSNSGLIHGFFLPARLIESYRLVLCSCGIPVLMH